MSNEDNQTGTVTIGSTNGLSALSVLGSGDCFASADVVRLQLGDINPRYASLWVEVKAEITVFERDTMRTSNVRAVTMREGEASQESRELLVDLAKGNYWKLKTWLVDWNLTGRNGKTAPLGESTLRNLKPEVADAILEALDRHIEGWESGKAESAE